VGSEYDLDGDNCTDKRVRIIYVGGTAGIKRVDGSLRPEKGYLTQQLKHSWPNLGEGLPQCTIVEANTLVDSSDMGPAQWVELAMDIEKHYLDYDG